MTIDECESCRRILAEHEDNDKLADILEDKHPRCSCQAHTVGEGSPGPVVDSEILFRIIVSPRDIDPVSGHILERPFEKAFKNGLSVCRSLATDNDILALTEGGQTLMICTASTETVRSVYDRFGEQVFCIYDQTVKRENPDQPPVPTHAGVFCRRPPRGTVARTKLQKDFAGKLRELFITNQIPVSQFRNGILSSE